MKLIWIVNIKKVVSVGKNENLKEKRTNKEINQRGECMKLPFFSFLFRLATRETVTNSVTIATE